MPTTATTPSALRSGWSELAFDLTAIALGLAALVGPGYVALLGVGETVHFLGETATPAEIAESRRLFALAGVLAVGVPLAGLLLCVGVRRSRNPIRGAGLPGPVGAEATDHRGRPGARDRGRASHPGCPWSG